MSVEPSPFVDAALANAARVWERMLSEIYPEYDWVVEVRQPDALDRQHGAASSVGRDDAGAVRDHANTGRDGDDASTADTDHKHGFEEAA